MIVVELSDRTQVDDPSLETWRARMQELITAEGFHTGEISIAIVDASEMRQLNRHYLDHDYHTDVLSFVIDREATLLNGEIIASRDMAQQRCQEFGWSAEHELGLYLIHGALHLVGYLDKTPADVATMRAREQHYLRRFGCPPCRPRSADTPSSPTSMEREAPPN